MDTLIQPAAQQLLSQGLLGIIVFFLVWYLGRKEQEAKDRERAYKEELAAKDKRIEELTEARLTDAKQFVGFSMELRSQGAAFLAAITERKSQ
jgi:hypothetical protein